MPKLVGEVLLLDQEALTHPVSMQEQTRSQVAIMGGGAYGLNSTDAIGTSNNNIVALGQDFTSSNVFYMLKVRRMRKHPTIKLVKILSCAGMATAKWSVETAVDAPKGAKEVVSDLLTMQSNILSSALPGIFDWGWQPFEKIFYWDRVDERTKLRKLKPLLQDITRIMVTADHGEFAGFKQFNKFLSLSNCLLLNQDVEGTYHYGESVMSAMEMAYDRWLVTDRSNVQYDKKICSTLGCTLS